MLTTYKEAEVAVEQFAELSWKLGRWEEGGEGSGVKERVVV